MKKVLSIVSIVFILAATAGVMITSAATYPNVGGITINGSSAQGYVQFSPSHTESDGRYAIQGRVRVILQDSEANISYTGYSYTVQNTNTSDTGIYSTTRNATIPSGGLAFAQYHFLWRTPDEWGNSFEETE